MATYDDLIAVARARQREARAVVTEESSQELRAQFDPLVGLSDVLVGEVRRLVVGVLADGSYAAAAAWVDRLEAAT